MIVLVVPFKRWNDVRYSLGVMYVASALEAGGYPTAIVDRGNLKDRWTYGQMHRYTVEKTIQAKPDLVGVSMLFNELNLAARVAGEVKQALGVPVFAGGSYPTTHPETVLSRGFDFAVRGEGERTVVELAEAFYGSRNYSRVLGLSYLADGRPVHNPPRPSIENLDSLPYPAYDKIDMRYYIGESRKRVLRGWDARTSMVLTSRGCPYNCSFCSCPTTLGRRLRARGPESIRGEVELLTHQYKAQAAWFVDDTLTALPAHLGNVCQVMRELRVPWGCQSRVGVNHDALKLMRDSGCVQIDFGVESGSNRVLREVIGKGTTVEQAAETFNLCHRLGIRTLANLMVGFPGETREEMEQTLQLGLRLKADHYVLSIATPIPGTQLWEMVKPDVTEDDYDRFDFFGGVLDRYNRSEVRDLKKLRDKYYDILMSSVKRK